MRTVLPRLGGMAGAGHAPHPSREGGLRQQFWHIKGAECNTFF